MNSIKFFNSEFIQVFLMSFQQAPRVIASAALVMIPPAAIQHYYATTSRKDHIDSVDDTSLPSSVVTTMDMYVDATLPGDIVMFKRSCSKCAASPLAALACFVQRPPLSDGYDHFGLLVPGTEKYSSPRVLEATPSKGVRLVDLAERLKYSRSDSIAILPLNVPGERRDLKRAESTAKNPANSTDKARLKMIEEVRSNFEKNLSVTAANQVNASQRMNYENVHSSLSFFGGLVAHYLPLSSTTKDLLYKGPIHPSCMVVLEALAKAGALGRQQSVEDGGLQKVVRKASCNDLVEGEGDKIELRPGWRYGKPVNLRI